ncbi:hypothetical protein H2204_004082 [Knufia peltigerae]|uniref:Uncharacterized protein n=1 Tax=Knufia peltigerae TaxID=1002370 RepID=A0AA38Y803_9EURO|nr:hypothetical protein H2204_004082 [Knufia peltigerae]
MAVPTYNSIKNSPLTQTFGMNEVAFLLFSEGKRYLLTVALNSCFGIFLVSPEATVSAHIPPHPGTNFTDPQAGDKNLISKMREFAAQYNSKKEYFSHYNVCLVIAKFHGKNPLPDKKAFIERCLRKFKVEFPIQDYEVKAPGEPRRDEHGTAFVDGMATSGAILYVEDKIAMRVKRPPSADAERVGSTTVPSSNPIFPREQSSDQQKSSGDTPNRRPAKEKDGQKESKPQLRYVKSTKSDTGARIVTIDERKVMIQAEEWKTAETNGRKILVCQRYMLYTDP